MKDKKVTRTNHGEAYNRESMYETAREVLLEGKEVSMNGKKYDTLIEVMIKDYEMEVNNEAEYVKQAENYLHS